MNYLFSMLLSLPWVLLAIVFHEFCHAWVSNRLGDPTPRLEGRLSLNPLVHIDPLGILALVIFHFGWAKPVMINPNYYRDPLRGTLWVSLAGPAGNFMLAVLFALVIRFFNFFDLWYLINPLISSVGISFLDYFLLGLAINLGFGFFNLIPVPPLDGSKILRFFIRGRAGFWFDRYQNFGFIVLIAFLYLGVIGWVLAPAVRFASFILTGYSIIF
jgi:Zn-dependent protease